MAVRVCPLTLPVARSLIGQVFILCLVTKNEPRKPTPVRQSRTQLGDTDAICLNSGADFWGRGPQFGIEVVALKKMNDRANSFYLFSRKFLRGCRGTFSKKFPYIVPLLIFHRRATQLTA